MDKIKMTLTQAGELSRLNGFTNALEFLRQLSLLTEVQVHYTSIGGKPPTIFRGGLCVTTNDLEG